MKSVAAISLGLGAVMGAAVAHWHAASRPRPATEALATRCEGGLSPADLAQVRAVVATALRSAPSAGGVATAAGKPPASDPAPAAAPHPVPAEAEALIAGAEGKGHWSEEDALRFRALLDRLAGPESDAARERLAAAINQQKVRLASGVAVW